MKSRVRGKLCFFNHGEDGRHEEETQTEAAKSHVTCVLSERIGCCNFEPSVENAVQSNLPRPQLYPRSLSSAHPLLSSTLPLVSSSASFPLQSSHYFSSFGFSRCSSLPPNICVFHSFMLSCLSSPPSDVSLLYSALRLHLHRKSPLLSSNQVLKVKTER